MTEQAERNTNAAWIFAAISAVLGAAILFDAHAGINWPAWVAITVVFALYCQYSGGIGRSRPATAIGIAAVLAATAEIRTTDPGAHFGIFCLTAFLLGLFIATIRATRWDDVRLFTLVTAPFVAVASVAVSAARKLGSLFQAESGSSSKTALRRVVLVAPVVLIILALLGGADPVIHSAVQNVGAWLPSILMPARAVFFVLLFVVTLGAFSRLPSFNLPLPFREARMRGGPTAADGSVLVASTLATLVLFLILQVIYLFIHLPNEIGNGVTYADYARRGFGELCVVVTIVAAAILFAEKLQRRAEVPDAADVGRVPRLRKLELATLGAAGLILLSALRRVVLYEQAYGFTVARVQATAYIVFMAGFLVLLGVQLSRGGVTPALARRSAALALVIILAILYWNDQAWIMNRNIDRIRTTGKFDAKYAASLSGDVLPTLARRKNEIPAADWSTLRDRMACKGVRSEAAWYEWNPVRSAAKNASDALALPELPTCTRRVD